jgi:hypothetical protein
MTIYFLVPLLVLFTAALAQTADLCEDRQCAQPVDDAKGVSLMQSGAAVLPTMGLKLSNSALEDGLVDQFAAMEDEFDIGGVVQPDTSGEIQSATSKQSAPRLTEGAKSHYYMETLLAIFIVTFAAEALKRSSSTSPEVLEKTESWKAETSVKAATDISEVGCPGSSVCAGSSKGFPALQEAVRAGDEVRCRDLLQQGGRRAVHQEDQCGCTALHVAAHCNSVAVARLLLEHGAKVNAREAWDETPLHIGARSGSVEVCRLLLTNGAEIDAVDALGSTALVAAGNAKEEGTCELLLSHGAGAGGLADDELPPLVNALLMRRLFAGGFA